MCCHTASFLHLILFFFMGLTFFFCPPPQREKLVLILVCAGAAFIVLVAIVSAIFAVKRTVYSLRWAGSTCKLHAKRRAPKGRCNSPWLNVALCRTPVYRFSNLQHQEEESGVTVDLSSATSSNGTTCQQDSDDVSAIHHSFSVIL